MTDDRDARKFAMRRGIPISGTLGILNRLVQSDILRADKGDQLLEEMIVKGYRSPVASLKEL